MNPIITASGLSKRYDMTRNMSRNEWIVAGVAKRTARILKRVLVPWKREPQSFGTAKEALWSLDDVSFEVRSGEVIGIIGNNGAGKTTLLRVLSGITEPTRGRAIVRGRVSSLLEVSIGFHPELTGRENVYMKAAIHGMRRAVVARQFDDIVAFAEMERFIDTPLKFYSTGMKSRLGMAVGMVLEHDVMVVDEALAVGDAGFQARASERIRRSVLSGATTLFVSHNLGQVADLCARSLWMDHGRLIADGPTPEVTERYLQTTRTSAGAAVREFQAGETGHIRSFRLLGEGDTATARFAPGEPLTAELHLDAVGGMHDLEARIVISDGEGQRLFRFRSAMLGLDLAASGAGSLIVRARIDALPLTPGQYNLGIELGRGRGLMEKVDNALRIEVGEGDPYRHGEPFVHDDGRIWVRGAWSCTDASTTRPLPDDQLH